jgi:hypothetical protein
MPDPDPVAAEADEPEEAPAARSRNTVALVATVLAAVFAVTTILLAVVAVGLKADKDEAGGGQEDVVAAASRFAQAFIDRDASVESLRDDVLPLATDEFADQFVDGVDQIMTASEAVGLRETRATINETFTTLADGPIVQAIVVYDATSTFADGRSVTNQNNYMVLELVEDDGAWLVRNVNDLLRIVSNGADAAGAVTTTTTPSG